MKNLAGEIELTEEQKLALKEAEILFNGLVKKYGFDVTRWAFYRKVKKENERKKLIAEKKRVEERLREIKEELD